MTRYARMPALVAIGIAALAGLAIFAVTGQFRPADLAHASLQDLEKKIVGSTDTRIWAAYGDKLREQGRFDHAARAYQRAIELQPDYPVARMNLGLTLAQSNPDAFFDYVARLAMNYPKAALNLIERPEMGALKMLTSDPRWELTKTAVHAQVVD